MLTKLNFSIKFPHLSKFIDLMKNLKFEHQSIFPLWGRVKLNFRDRYGRPNIFSDNSSHCQVFSIKLSKNDTLVQKRKSLTTKMDLYNSHMVPHTILWGNNNFPRGTYRIQIFYEISTSGKFMDVMKDLKYEHQSIFPLWGRVKLNFRDR